jgi:hypothetical protein
MSAAANNSDTKFTIKEVFELLGKSLYPYYLKRHVTLNEGPYESNSNLSDTETVITELDFIMRAVSEEMIEHGARLKDVEKALTELDENEKTFPNESMGFSVTFRPFGRGGSRRKTRRRSRRV